MSSGGSPLIRPAYARDLPALGKLGALLLRTHYTFDPLRFMRPGQDSEDGYAWFLGTQLKEDNVLILIAEDRATGRIVGYVYAALEPQSWKELREPAGFIHDLAVEESDRRRGVASALIESALEWLRGRGAPRAILGTAAQNEAAQRLFARLNFRPTMIEMTRELTSD